MNIMLYTCTPHSPWHAAQ